MYPLDRRKLAIHVYSLLSSLRKTAALLQVSHSTISRWLVSPERKVYRPRPKPKETLAVDVIKSAIQNNPFVTEKRQREKENFWSRYLTSGPPAVRYDSKGLTGSKIHDEPSE